MGGTPQSSHPLGNPWMYTARFTDEETGLYYYRARYYSPETGRFLQRDPFGYRQGANLHEYSDGRPTCLVDPLGLYTQPVYGPADSDDTTKKLDPGYYSGSESDRAEKEAAYLRWYEAMQRYRRFSPFLIGLVGLGHSGATSEERLGRVRPRPAAPRSPRTPKEPEPPKQKGGNPVTPRPSGRPNPPPSTPTTDGSGLSHGALRGIGRTTRNIARARQRLARYRENPCEMLEEEGVRPFEDPSHSQGYIESKIRHLEEMIRKGEDNIRKMREQNTGAPRADRGGS